MEFKKYTVEELVKLDMLEKPMDGNHGSKHPTGKDYVKEGIPFIMVSDINNGKINYKTCKYISKDTRNNLDKGFAKPDDVLLSHKATVGLTAIVGDEFEEIVLTPQLTYYRVKNNINNKYLKYYFDSPYFQNILKNWATSGSTRAYLGITAQLKLPILLPDMNNQNKIANILSMIDKKIELNNHINNNLYELGDAIYKELILDRYDKTNKLSILYRFQYGKGNNNPSNGGKYPVYGSNGVIGGYDEFNNEDAPVIGHIGANCGSLIFAYGKHYVTYNGIMCNIINNNYRYFGYETLRFLNIKREIRGSSQPFISYDLLNSFDIPLPKNSIVVNIENKLKTIYTSIKNNLDEINTLMQLRDILLPKLMKGEIDLDKIEW